MNTSRVFKYYMLHAAHFYALEVFHKYKKRFISTHFPAKLRPIYLLYLRAQIMLMQFNRKIENRGRNFSNDPFNGIPTKLLKIHSIEQIKISAFPAGFRIVKPAFFVITQVRRADACLTKFHLIVAGLRERGNR